MLDLTNVHVKGVLNDVPNMKADLIRDKAGEAYRIAILPPPEMKVGIATLKLQAEIAGHLREFPIYVIVR